MIGVFLVERDFVMEYRKLGFEGPTVSVVCLGCWAIGGIGPDMGCVKYFL